MRGMEMRNVKKLFFWGVQRPLHLRNYNKQRNGGSGQVDEREQHKKIIIEAMHGMGDVVCMLPMIKEIKEAYPNGHTTILVNKMITIDIIKCSGIRVENIIAIDAHENKWEFLRNCMKLRKEHFDISICSANTPVKKAKLVMGIINAKAKIGIQYTLNTNFNGLNDQYHFVDAHNLILEEMGIENHHYLPILRPNEEAINKFKNVLQVKSELETPIIGICIGRADISYRNKCKRSDPVYTRGWGDYSLHLRNMSDVINKSLEKGWKVILIGGKAEMDIHDGLDENILKNDSCFDYVGKTNVAGSIALASLCDVVVGVDTGMQHIADAVGSRTVSIFGPTNPKTHGAYSAKAAFAEIDESCRFCYGTKDYEKCENRKCLNKITSDAVFQLVQNQVNKALEGRKQ